MTYGAIITGKSKTCWFYNKTTLFSKTCKYRSLAINDSICNYVINGIEEGNYLSNRKIIWYIFSMRELKYGFKLIPEKRTHGWKYKWKIMSCHVVRPNKSRKFPLTMSLVLRVFGLETMKVLKKFPMLLMKKIRLCRNNIKKDTTTDAFGCWVYL